MTLTSELVGGAVWEEWMSAAWSVGCIERGRCDSCRNAVVQVDVGWDRVETGRSG